MMGDQAPNIDLSGKGGRLVYDKARRTIVADGEKNDRWFTQHRQEWIAETVRIFGYINREHIQRKFGISTPQASYDLKLFMERNPGVIEYNTSAKSYVSLKPLSL